MEYSKMFQSLINRIPLRKGESKKEWINRIRSQMTKEELYEVIGGKDAFQKSVERVGRRYLAIKEYLFREEYSVDELNDFIYKESPEAIKKEKDPVMKEVMKQGRVLASDIYYMRIDDGQFAAMRNYVRQKAIKDMNVSKEDEHKVFTRINSKFHYSSDEDSE